MNNELLGMTGIDKITGFRGTITGVASYLTGCDQVCLLPKSVDNKAPEGVWYDINRITVPNDNKVVLNTSKDNGPMDPPSIR